jgi:hypothetical protein
MTDKLIKEQIRAIEKATKSAAGSKETALKFLQDAGIVKNTADKPKKKK